MPASHSFQGAVEKVVRRASQKEAHAPGLAFYMTCREAPLGPAQWACRASATHRWPFDEMARRGRERGLVKGGGFHVECQHRCCQCQCQCQCQCSTWRAPGSEPGQFSSMARRLRLRLEPPRGDAGDLREEWRADFSNRGAKYYETTRRNSSRSIHSLFDPSFAASRGSRCCVRHPPRGASTKGKLK